MCGKYLSHYGACCFISLLCLWTEVIYLDIIQFLNFLSFLDMLIVSYPKVMNIFSYISKAFIVFPFNFWLTCNLELIIAQSMRQKPCMFFLTKWISYCPSTMFWKRLPSPVVCSAKLSHVLSVWVHPRVWDCFWITTLSHWPRCLLWSQYCTVIIPSWNFKPAWSRVFVSNCSTEMAFVEISTFYLQNMHIPNPNTAAHLHTAASP